MISCVQRPIFCSRLFSSSPVPQRFHAWPRRCSRRPSPTGWDDRAPVCFVFFGNEKESAPLHKPTYDFTNDGLIFGAKFHASIVRKIFFVGCRNSHLSKQRFSGNQVCSAHISRSSAIEPAGALKAAILSPENT